MSLSENAWEVSEQDFPYAEDIAIQPRANDFSRKRRP